MKAVVEGLLTLARADARDVNLQKEPLELKSVVEEAAAMLAPLAAEKKVTLEVKADPVGVTGDRSRLGEVAVNLVGNALRYNREGGRVDVVLRADGPDAVLTVADSGIGIPAKDQPHIFERFYRVDKARSREQGGTGLGLAIAKWVVEAHGGTIAFTSKEGEGTTLTVRLPKTR
jgi:signal transduction histidine kinase